MTKENALFFIIALSCITHISFAKLRKAEAQVQLQINNAISESTVIVDSKNYTHVSMENENLGFALRLLNTQKDRERIETSPTCDKNQIASCFMLGRNTDLHFHLGCTFNGHKFDKDLIIKILTIKKLASEKPVQLTPAQPKQSPLQ